MDTERAKWALKLANPAVEGGYKTFRIYSSSAAATQVAWRGTATIEWLQRVTLDVALDKPLLAIIAAMMADKGVLKFIVILYVLGAGGVGAFV